jgi:signal transduction histidine kinase
LIHALFNLLDNACRATPSGGTVRVRAREAGESVRIEIQDGGAGLPPGLDHAQRLAPSKSGSGLGLLAARRFLSQDGGTLSFDRLESGGTSCCVTLPALSVAPAHGAGAAGS